MEQLVELPPAQSAESAEDAVAATSLEPTLDVGDFEPDVAAGSAAEEPEAAPGEVETSTDAEVPSPGDAGFPGESQILSRSEFSNTYDMGQGERFTQVSLAPVNVRVGGKWLPIQTAVAGTGFWSFLGIGGGEV
ncbi:hypothetical protein [Agromyces rhizosphaerae]|uniref:hypothetical protein n=1 Tax=Agromyces rhizosphaerae TaxID=88374 RepID=UPI0024939234|nr:hypothetical protein [Agromyces rhizosphaerae]